MRHVILAIRCAATLAVIATAFPAHAQWVPRYGDRPPPPTEPSIVLPGQPQIAAPKPEAPKPAVKQIIVRRPHSVQSGPVTMPPNDVLVMMVRAALSALNQANFTENYSVLRGMMTPGLQVRASAAQLAKAFADLRSQNLDLSPSLVLMPQLTENPTLAPGGLLKVAGIFPSKPLQIKFALEYLPIDGFWMIDSMTVSAPRADTPVAMVAPKPPPAVTPPAPPAPSPVLAAPAQVASRAPVALPAPAPVAAAPQRLAMAADADFIPGSLPTRQFIPVRYPVEYRPAFVQTGRQAQADSHGNAKTNAKVKAKANTNATAPGYAVYVQVTSQRSEAEAKAAYNSLRAKFPQILGDRQPVIRRADLGDKGIFYRAQIGPVSSDQADEKCRQLKAVGGHCFIQYD
ncbi:MAG TPA: SPOR domain-containing protein [Pseudolabrys sp.]|nr:SPOR domain-containing protein [Pseudolabrys sp.]